MEDLREDRVVLRGIYRHTTDQWNPKLYGSGRVVAVGDAAHAMMPDGRGGAQAVEDAYWLGRLVSEEGLVEGLGPLLGSRRENRVRLCLELDVDKPGVFARYA